MNLMPKIIECIHFEDPRSPFASIPIANQANAFSYLFSEGTPPDEDMFNELFDKFYNMQDRNINLILDWINLVQKSIDNAIIQKNEP